MTFSPSIVDGGIWLTGYDGKNCEIDIDECAYTDPPICQAGAPCHNSPNGSFTCDCPSQPADDGMFTFGKYLL